MSISEILGSASDSQLERLLVQARLGSGSALGELLQSCRQYLLLLADDELGSDLKAKVSPSDVVQDSFLEARRDFQQFAGGTPQQFLAWLRRVLLNNVANVLRDFRQTARRNITLETVLADYSLDDLDRDNIALSPSAAAVQNEEFTALGHAIARLPEHYQTVIHWRNYERLSFEQIGTQLGRSAEAARKIWVRAIEMLQQELDHPDDSSPKGI
jgi:RNA polymerase sigma-70 factor (ECF subfamily)